MAADAWWEIRNADGEDFCRRATKRACVEMLKKYAGTKYWDNGPYTVWRMTAERRYTHRDTPSSSVTPEKP